MQVLCELQGLCCPVRLPEMVLAQMRLLGIYLAQMHRTVAEMHTTHWHRSMQQSGHRCSAVTVR